MQDQRKEDPFGSSATEEEKDTDGDGGGFLGMPLGFKFDHKNQVAVVENLRKKVSGLPLPYYYIPTVDVYSTEPWNLIPPGQTDACYFSPIVLYENSKRPSRRAGEGSWTANGKTEVVVGGIVVERKQLLSFHPEGTEKPWDFVMQEYELAEGPDDFVFCWIKANAQPEKQAERNMEGDPENDSDFESEQM